MSNTARTTKTNQEKIKMRKLIVEAPELKEGQTDSSGGIRENGKISVQYKNPVPYVEPKLPPATLQKTYTRKDMLKDQAKDLAMNIGTDLISTFWNEFGRPFAHAKLHQLGQKAIERLEAPSKLSQSISYEDIDPSEIIDVECVDYTETDNLADNDKIIRFPNRRIS